MKILGIIPARGGSKRVLGKNIRMLAGKPLIGWTIEAMQTSGCIDQIIVSTECPHITNVVESYGVEVLKCPPELAGDTIPLAAVVEHVLDEIGTDFNIIVNCCATVPLRTAKDIQAAFNVMHDKKAQAVVSVSPTTLQIQRMNTLPSDGWMGKFMHEEYRLKCSQELDTFYMSNGAVQLAHIPYFRKYGDWYGPNTFAYVMPETVDIDTEHDFGYAEYLMGKSQVETILDTIARAL